MIRSTIAAFVVVCLCFAIMQIPGRPESVALPTAEALPPQWETIALPQAASCPGGVCPVPTRVVAADPVVRQSVASVSRSSHWSYPGDIGSHLASDHGVSAAGMSREQAESWHDRLHESVAGSSRQAYTPVQSYAYTRSSYRTVGRPVRRVASLPVRLLQRQPVRSFARRIFCR